VTETARRLTRLTRPHARARALALVLAGTGAALLACAAGLSLAPHPAGVAAAWLAAVHPALVWMPAYVLSETLFSLLALGCVAVLDRAVADGTPCYETTADILASLAEKENPQGVIAVVRQLRVKLADLTSQNFPWGVAIVSPQDPGNVGTILRTIDAVGASGLILLNSGVDPYHPTAVRASLGSIFWHPIVSALFSEWSQWTQQQAYHIYGTSAKGSTDYKEVDVYKQPLIVLLGGEREGLSREQAAVCDQLVRLPMRGHVSSLNLAVAAGVMLYAVMDRLK